VLSWPVVERQPAGLTDYFPQRGYAVAIVDLRGTGRSQGCLDHLGPTDARDAKEVVEWAARQPWSSGRVGVTGFSYPAMASVLALSTRPQGLVTAVPVAAIASMYEHQFQAGVPYAFQWAGPMVSYPLGGTVRHLPPNPVSELTAWPWGDNFGNDPQYAACGWMASSLTTGEAQLSGQSVEWHAQRDFRAPATAARIPVFLVHGLYDKATRSVASRWFFEREPGLGDKVWLGPWGHSSPRAAQLTEAIHAWFDHHLMQRTWVGDGGARHPIDTGPPVEVFLSDAETLEAAQLPDQRDAVAVAGAWPRPDVTLALHPHSGGALALDEEATEGSVAFTGDSRDSATGIVKPDYNEDTEATGNATFVSAPFEEDTLLLGQPELKLSASVTAPRVHVIATAYDESPSGARRRITTFAMNPELRNGIDQIAPVIPGQRMELRPPGSPVAHDLRAGHRIVLRVTTSQQDKVGVFSVDPRVTVFTGRDATMLRLPTVASALLIEDTVPLQ
ncbi:MAG: CocE/NonD family hydrolase, partial [Actinomycetota bacterium]|nr:CocE/NonD family hydrolase [Actinomycetota bacterium]